MTINAAHRKHYKSGACLRSDPWATDAQIVRRSSPTPLLDAPLPPARGFFQTIKDWLFSRADVEA